MKRSSFLQKSTGKIWDREDDEGGDGERDDVDDVEDLGDDDDSDQTIFSAESEGKVDNSNSESEPSGWNDAEIEYLDKVTKVIKNLI